jgi:AcrR family transcriptional regulator
VGRRASAAATRRRLLDVGRAAFGERGLDGVNLQRDVLTPAGVSVGSFYHQFRDKTDLLVAILDEASEFGQAVLTGARATPTDPTEATRAAYEALFALVDGGEDIMRIQMRERDHPDERISSMLARSRAGWVDVWATEFERYAGPGSPFDPRGAAEAVVALGLGAVQLYLDVPAAGRAARRESLLATLVPFTVGGFVALGAVPER